jgi:hypothetical protein
MFRVSQIQLSCKYDRWRKIVRSLNLSSKAQLRLEWIIDHDKGATIKEVNERFVVGESTIKKWKARFKDYNLRSLEDESKIPKTYRKRQFCPKKDK